MAWFKTSNQATSGVHTNKDCNGISPEVFSQRAGQGLCGYCGEQRWRPGHRCKTFNQEPTKQQKLSTKKQIQMVQPKDQDAEVAHVEKFAMSIANAIVQSSFVRGDLYNVPVKILVDTIETRETRERERVSLSCL